jgi:hypothetical protein
MTALPQKVLLAAQFCFCRRCNLRSPPRFRSESLTSQWTFVASLTKHSLSDSDKLSPTWRCDLQSDFPIDCSNHAFVYAKIETTDGRQVVMVLGWKELRFKFGASARRLPAPQPIREAGPRRCTLFPIHGADIEMLKRLSSVGCRRRLSIHREYQKWRAILQYYRLVQ